MSLHRRFSVPGVGHRFAVLTMALGAALSVGHCSNEVTAPSPAQVKPTVVPVGLPASLHGGVSGFNGASPTVAVAHGIVKVTQGQLVRSASTNGFGTYEIDGLQSGRADVEASGGNYASQSKTIFLSPGSNTLGLELYPSP
jgi:hypothetical protein